MTPPRIELGIYRVSGDRVSHCTTESSLFSSFSFDYITSLPSLLFFFFLLLVSFQNKTSRFCIVVYKYATFAYWEG